MYKQLIVYAIEFKRNEVSEWEEGIFIGKHETDENGKIVDFEGNIVLPPIWNYRDRYYRGTQTFFSLPKGEWNEQPNN